ncbi:hypothetical protein GCM10010384_15500 [Streptomyces djakartensis]|uniref:Uncharacterized protein n=1 Tax=Streptomyces djakartensis TaxID=68193 RepID=A0ABQ2ZBH3_9ACTN|nr:hypothetical protein GCM10010384_15500 [Streptomyces djakartensis]
MQHSNEGALGPGGRSTPVPVGVAPVEVLAGPGALCSYVAHTRAIHVPEPAPPLPDSDIRGSPP